MELPETARVIMPMVIVMADIIMTTMTTITAATIMVAMEIAAVMVAETGVGMAVAGSKIIYRTCFPLVKTNEITYLYISPIQCT
jgi:hypothetical protein